MDDGYVFSGFNLAAKGYSKLFNDWLDEICSQIDNVSELKIVLYVYRMTVGFNKPNDYKHITVDDFMRGWMKTDGTRIDRGTGMSEQSVRNGIKKAIQHKYVLCKTDDHDLARVEKSYKLNVVGVQSLGGEVQSLDPNKQRQGKSFRPRTVKDNNTEQSNKDNGSSSSSNKMGVIRIAMRECLRLFGNEHDQEYRERAHALLVQSGLAVVDFRARVDSAVNSTKLAGGDIEYFFVLLERACSVSQV